MNKKSDEINNKAVPKKSVTMIPAISSTSVTEMISPKVPAIKSASASELNSDTRELSSDAIVILINSIITLKLPLSLPHPIALCTVSTYNVVLTDEKRRRCGLEYKNGTCTVVECPSKEHGTTVWEIGLQIANAVGNDDLVARGDSTCDSSLPGQSAMQPDASWWLRRGLDSSSDSSSSGASSAMQSPNAAEHIVLVLEVGYTQSLADLQAKARRWLHETAAREVVLIKMNQNRDALLGQIWRKNAENPVQSVDFSEAVSPGTHKLSISISNLFGNRAWTIPLNLRLPGLAIVIDLFYIRRALQRIRQS